jgi:hypothetical protein
VCDDEDTSCASAPPFTADARQHGQEVKLCVTARCGADWLVPESSLQGGDALHDIRLHHMPHTPSSGNPIQQPKGGPCKTA